LVFWPLRLLARNTVIHTFPAVSQFWKYPPDTFLKEPVYSRDYPAC
jgi:branched-chain amino acid transport system substrate-binding protein